jgi:hypothetical protein
MKHLLLLSNILLSIVAVLLTVKLLEERDNQVARSSKVQPLGDIQAEPIEDGPTRQQVPETASKRMERKNLFHIDRFYDDGTGKVAGGDAGLNDTGPKLNEEYELTGTVKIGKGLAAVIIVRQPQPQRSTVRKYNIPTRSTRSTTRTPVKPPPRPTSKTAEKGKVYRLNDEVGELGYVLTEIEFDAVVLTKTGAEPLTLTLNRQDETSMGRREAAQKEITAKRKAAEAAAAKTAALAARAKALADSKARSQAKTSGTSSATRTVPPPPPPPPPLNLPGGPNAGPPRATTSGSSRTSATRPTVTTRPSTAPRK